jgi:Cof subfamily protein (haloacid dehalogenase superfamily)
MQYKALMLDVDGTIIPYEYDALPTKRVKEAIKKAKEKVAVCIVTGRSYKSTKGILNSLNLKDGIAVVDGGAIVIDIETEKILSSNFISEEDVELVLSVFEKESAHLFIKDAKSRLDIRDHYDPYVQGQKFELVSQFFTDEVFTLEATHGILKKLSSPTLTTFRSKHKDPNLYGLNIANIHASKLHGVLFVSQKLGINRSEMIGVGDGYNDFPLLEACGLKVAMGNALEDLKGIADYIAPSVDEDGVANVIEKFILI